MLQSVPHPAVGASPPHPRAGFTLVELIIATAVLSVGILALAGAAGAIIRLEHRGDRLSHGAGAAETRLELLRARGCSAESGVSVAGGSAERWTVVRLPGGLWEITDSVTAIAPAAGIASRARVYRSAARC